MNLMLVRPALPPPPASVCGAVVLAAAMLLGFPGGSGAADAAPGGVEPSSAGAAAAPVVGALGDPEAIDFEGNASFTGRALRRGLAYWPGYLKAAHPNEPLAGYLAAVRDALERGYRALGFPGAAVRVARSASGDRVAAQIQEGPRFRLGEVRVEGTKAVPAADVVRALTSPPPAVDPLVRVAGGVTAQRHARERREASERKLDETAAAAGLPVMKPPRLEAPALEGLMPSAGADEGGAPCFVAGEPASFTDGYLEQVRSAAGRFLAARGYPLAKLEAALEPDRSAGLAHLRVRLDEGPPAVIGTIRVTGKPRSSPEAIVRCAGLSPGMPASAAVIDQARVALWNSGRFYVFDLDARPRDPPSAEVDVTIEVDENESLPPVGEPVPRAMAAAMRFANWMTTEASRRGFFLSVAHGRALTAEIAITGQRAAGVVEDGQGALLGFTAGADRHQLVAANAEKAVEVDLDKPESVISLTMGFTTGRDPALREVFSFWGGMRQLGDAPGAREARCCVETELVVSPAWIGIPFEGLGDRHFRFEDPLVILSRAGEGGKHGVELRFREDTGELVSLDMRLDLDEGPGAEPWRFVAGLAQERVGKIASRIEAARSRLPRAGEPRPLFSDVLLGSPALQRLLSQLFPSFTASPARFAQGVRLGERLAVSLLRSLFTVDRPREGGDRPGEEESFFVPADPNVMEQPALLAQLLGVGLPVLLEKSWPGAAWPGRLFREYFYILCGLTTHTDQVLEEIARDPQMGPLGSLLAARLLGGRSPAWGWRFARRAVDHAAVAEFGRDWRQLMGEHSWQTEVAVAFLESLRELSEGEAAALASGLPEAEGSLVSDALADLRRRDGRPVLEVVGPHVDRWWERQVSPGFEGRVAAMFDGGDAVDAVLVAATANGAPVSRRLVHLRRSVPDLFDWYPAAPPEAVAAAGAAEPDALEIMLRLALVDREFGMRGGFVKDEYLDQLIAETVQRDYAGDRAAHEAGLARRGLTLADLREAIRLREVLAFMLDPVVRNVPVPADEEIDRLLASYVATAGDVAHLRVVRVPKIPGEESARRALAESIRARVLRDGSVEGICPAGDAQDPAAPSCHDLPETAPGEMAQALDEAAFALEPGGVSEVVESPAALLIVQLVTKGPRKPSEENRRGFAMGLLLRRQLEAIGGYLDRLRAESVVRALADPSSTAANPAPGERAVRLEFETLKLANTERTEVLAEAMAAAARRWSGGAQARCRSEQGGWAEWEFEVAAEGDYEIQLLATRSPGYGQVQLSLDGADLGDPVELASPVEAQPSGARRLGQRHLAGGRHVLRCTAAGRLPWSSGYDFGLDALDLVPASIFR